MHINKYQYLSKDIFKYEQIWMHINEYQYISTNINKYQYLYIRKFPQASINVNKYEWKSTKIIDNEQNEQIPTNTTKQISTNIWHKYLALAQLLFQVSSNYVNTMWKRTTWPPKASSQALATLEQPTEALSQYISTNINTYQQISIHINKYVQI
jgi:hypothetical protein